MRQLRLPVEAMNDPDAREILRVWSSGDNQGFAFDLNVWTDPAVWGLLLVDLAPHVAKGHSERHGGGPATALSRTKAGFDAEWANPTGASTVPAGQD